VATPTKVEDRPPLVEAASAGRPMPSRRRLGEAAGMNTSCTAIEVEHLRKLYGRKVAVDDVSFTVAEGEIFGLLGRNGAGKSTAVDCIVGLRVPDQGRIRVAGLDPRRDRRELRQLLGVQLQESQLQDKLTVAEAMRLYASFYRHPADIDSLLAMLDLTEKRNTRYRKLSGGQKQRLSIALALIGRPRIAILDELTTGLDPVARRDTWQLIDDIRNSGVTIMLITHFMTEAERLCDRVAIMRDGQIAALGTPAALGSPTLEDTFVALTDRAPTDRALVNRALTNQTLLNQTMRNQTPLNHPLTDRRPR
jgi:ABC-2 type transport system ATP-binding protein